MIIVTSAFMRGMLIYHHQQLELTPYVLPLSLCGFFSFLRKRTAARGWVLISTGFAMAIALSGAPAAASTLTQDTDEETRRVVILNSSDPNLPAFRALDSSLSEALEADSRVPVDLYTEALDMHRFHKTLIEQDTATLLEKKYRDLKVDVVVADGMAALDFAQRHRDDIWPGAVIVFNSVPTTVLNEYSLAPGVIGIPFRLEFEEILKLMLKVRSASHHIAVIAGVGDTDRKLLALAKPSIQRYTDRLDIQYLVGLSIDETVEAVKTLPPDAVVLYLTVFRDGAGEPHVPRDVLTRVAESSPVPVFGMFETYLGFGIAAGTITSYGAQGRSAGALVARVLNGEDPDAIGMQPAIVPACMADWKQLKRWRIDTDLLPAGCEIHFKPVTVLDTYLWQILAVLTVILVQAVLIVVLMLNRRRLRRARDALKAEHEQRNHIEAIAGNLRGRLARFSKERTLGAMATTIAHEINQPLIAIQNYAQAANRRLESGDIDKSKLIELLGKIEGQAKRAGTITQRVRSLVNRIEPQLTVTPLRPLLDEVKRIMEPESEARACRVECNTVSDLTTVLADPLQVQLVLVNLLQNSMQSVCSMDQYDRRISVDVQPINDRETQISVMDWGPGIPAERATHVFEALDSGTSVGMGMGLAICRDIIGSHGGRIWYEPNPAGGAVFRFTLKTASQ